LTIRINFLCGVVLGVNYLKSVCSHFIRFRFLQWLRYITALPEGFGSALYLIKMRVLKAILAASYAIKAIVLIVRYNPEVRLVLGPILALIIIISIYFYI